MGKSYRQGKGVNFMYDLERRSSKNIANKTEDRKLMRLLINQTL